jgi:hypothetical protein
VKLVICGPPGIGKSTLGAKADKPVFLDLEDGCEHLKDGNERAVAILQYPKTLAGVNTAITDLTNDKHDYKTLVIDSADWLEKIIHAQIVGDSGKSIITINKGYGAGLAESTKLHMELVRRLSELSRARNMHIIVTAHVDVKPVKDPSVMDDYDSFEMKCGKEISPMWREWSEAFLFARHPVVTKNSDETVKARAMLENQRVVYTEETPFFKAKNRYNLPKIMPFTQDFWKEMSKYTSKGPQAPTLEKIRMEINDRHAKITDETLRGTVHDAILGAGTDIGQLTLIVERLREIQGAA